MAETVAGPLGELRGGTSTGVSLSTTPALIQIPRGTRHVFLTPRNFSAAVVARVAINPYLVVLKTTDGLATAPTEYNESAQDGSASTDVDLSSLGTAASGDFLYVGAHRPFRGVAIDIDSANGNASVLTVKYWDGNSWEDISATDGTASGGAALAVDGNVTWTVPSDWSPTTLIGAGDTTITFPFAGNKLYWTRWEFSAALDAATTLNSMLALAPSTEYFELVANQNFEVGITKGPEGVGCIEALTDAGTGNLVVGFAAGRGARF